jgi:hypothetical protein
MPRVHEPPSLVSRFDKRRQTGEIARTQNTGLKQASNIYLELFWLWLMWAMAMQNINKAPTPS